MKCIFNYISSNKSLIIFHPRMDYFSNDDIGNGSWGPIDEEGVKNEMLFERSEFISFLTPLSRNGSANAAVLNFWCFFFKKKVQARPARTSICELVFTYTPCFTSLYIQYYLGKSFFYWEIFDLKKKS